MKKTLMRTVFLLILAMVLTGLFGSVASSQTPAKTRTLRMQSSWSSGLQVQEQADEFARLIGEMSGGSLKVESLIGGSVVGAMEVFNAVDSGVIDIAHSCAFNWVANEPAAPLFGSRPFGLTAMEYIMWLYNYGGLEMWKEMYEKYNFGWVGACGLNLAEDFAWTNKELNTIEDFKGLKFRTVGYWGQILNSIGAAVVTLPASELYSSLNTGILDATEFSNPEADFGLGLHEVCKYLYTPGIHQPTSISEVIVNKDVWDSLTGAEQTIIKTAARAVTLQALSISPINDVAALKKFEKHGTQIRRIPPAVVTAVEKAANELYARKCAEDPFFKKVWESQEEIKKIHKTYNDYMDTSTYFD